MSVWEFIAHHIKTYTSVCVRVLTECVGGYCTPHHMNSSLCNLACPPITSQHLLNSYKYLY